MKLFGRKLEGFAKALVVLVAVLLVSSGLCGLSGSIEASHHWYFLGPGNPNTFLGNTLTCLDLVSAAAIAISAVGIAFVAIGWPVSTLYRVFARPSKDRLQRLFEDSESKMRDGKE